MGKHKLGRRKVFEIISRAIPGIFLLFSLLGMYNTKLGEIMPLFPVGISELTISFRGNLPYWLHQLSLTAFTIYRLNAISLVLPITDSFWCCVGGFILLPLFAGDIFVLHLYAEGYGEEFRWGNPLAIAAIESLFLIATIIRFILVLQNKRMQKAEEGLPKTS